MEKYEFPHLNEGESVKNLKRKVDEIGRPSVFIGSVSESIWIAEQVQAYFEEEMFEVDVWHQGVFALTKTHGGKASNAEQLKNFTDIYDFAIFVFSPDDEIISQYRKDAKGKNKEALATRHNIVFEFGLFLGRIGAKRSFILFDDHAADFIKHFFTDLKENISDVKEVKASEVDEENKFRIELYPYKGTSGKSATLEQKQKEFDFEDLKEQVEKIKERISRTFESIDISFLPSTSLAIGFYKNFVKIVVENIYDILTDNISGNTLKVIQENESIKDLVQLLKKKRKHIQFKIVIPNSIEAANPGIIRPYLKRCSVSREIPGKSRKMNILLKPESVDIQNQDFIIYDVPTTMYSSVEAVDMLNPHKNIRELLSEKEKRNFEKVLSYRIENEEKPELKKLMKEMITVIKWDEFLKETGQG